MKTGKPLDKTLPGAVVPQYRWVGGKRYGPYWSRVWRSGGRVHTAYVKAADLQGVREACERGRTARLKASRMLAQVRATRSDFTLMLRLLRRMDADGRIDMSEDELRRAERFIGSRWAE